MTQFDVRIVSFSTGTLAVVDVEAATVEDVLRVIESKSRLLVVRFPLHTARKGRTRTYATQVPGVRVVVNED